MSGGITQLLAVGEQDTYIKATPKQGGMSYFHTVYKQHTNFSQTVERQLIQGNPTPGSVSTIRFEKKGDMLGYVYLTKKSTASPPQASPFLLGNEIKKMELYIGGALIDEQEDDFSSMIYPSMLSTQLRSKNDWVKCVQDGKFRPITFWFANHWQCALPLVAMPYQTVEIRITWGDDVDSSSYTYECWANFTHLDAPERQIVANEESYILMYQTQKVLPSHSNIQELNFNHPVKFIAATEALVASPETTNIKFQLNGTDIGDTRTIDPHYTFVKQLYHTSKLFQVNPSTQMFKIPFCLDTTRFQPTGTLNFSRVDSARLLALDGGIFNQNTIYGVNYNILHIKNGMAGLMFAN